MMCWSCAGREVALDGLRALPSVARALSHKYVCMYVTVLHVETQAAAAQQVLALRGQLAEKEGALDGLRATLSAARRSLTARAAAAELALAERGAQAAEAAGRAEQQDGELVSAEAVSACQHSVLGSVPVPMRSTMA